MMCSSLSMLSRHQEKPSSRFLKLNTTIDHFERITDILAVRIELVLEGSVSLVKHTFDV